ncbi:MAG: N-acetylmuramoyl-L-alanine amidase, partial [Chloroflexi bacterium]|nr:N-acetylmuramoyl-L-alanine amidase [Chloroflexota bacterium]
MFRPRLFRASTFLLLAALLFPRSVPAFAAASPTTSLAGKVIAIDPGHGSPDPGTVDFGYHEADITLAVGLQLKALLEAAGAKTVYTRTSDRALAPAGSSTSVELQARCDLANNAGAQLFVSIHVNESSNPNYSGVTTYYGPTDGYYSGAKRTQQQVTASSQLAQLVESDVAAATGETADGVDDAPFYVLGHTTMPSILVETGFLSNRAEATNLTNPAYQQRLAKGVFQGIADYIAGAGATLAPAPPPRPVAPPPADAQFLQDVTFPD